MIICVCHGVCDKELTAVIASGADSVEKVERQCGAGGDCGTCRPDIERLIELKSFGPVALGRATPASGTTAVSCFLARAESGDL